MAEKIIPDVGFFAQEIIQEMQADSFKQRIKIAERLMNFSPDEMSELHLQDWYGAYWRLLHSLQFVKEPPQNLEAVARQILNFAQLEINPVRLQYCALALLLFGKVREFQALANRNLWSANLRDDFNIFAKCNELIGTATNLQMRANVRRNLQIKNFLYNKYADLLKKYSAASVDTCPKVAPENYRIYFCWLQGEENLPPIVRCCYNSLKMNAGRYKICFIDEQNYSDYIALPEHIVKKFNGGGGYITNAFFGYYSCKFVRAVRRLVA